MKYKHSEAWKPFLAGWSLPTLLVCLLWANADARAGEYRILPDQSVFAIVTHKAGFAAGKAHSHFIAASNYKAYFEHDESNPLASRFQLEFATEDLVVDSPEHQQERYPRIEALEILDEPFKGISEKDRAKVRETMLSKKQLDADAFPRISARVEEVVVESSTVGRVALPYRVTVRLEVHGQEVAAPVAARYERDGDTVRIELEMRILKAEKTNFRNVAEWAMSWWKRADGMATADTSESAMPCAA